MSSWPVARLQVAGPSGEVQIARLFEGRINPAQILPALTRKGVSGWVAGALAGSLSQSPFSRRGPGTRGGAINHQQEISNQSCE